jgi:hypothetical protein
LTNPEEDPAPSCIACEAELATVTLRTELGEIRIGPKCSRLIETLARLCGLDPKRRANLKRVA